MDYLADDQPAYVKAPAGAEAKRTRVQKDDVLLTITGSKIGRAARVESEHDGSYVSQHVSILRLGSGLDPDVLTAFLVSEQGGQRLIARSQYGQTKPGLNLAQIRSFPIPVPPVDVQLAIRRARREIRSLHGRFADIGRTTDDLLQSLVHGAFHGALGFGSGAAC